MKILNVDANFDQISGGRTVERTFQMSKSLVEAKHKCGILTLNIGLIQERLNALDGIELSYNIRNVFGRKYLNLTLSLPFFSGIWLD